MATSPDTLARTIGLRVKSHRARRGWTLDQLAEQAGVSRRMVVNVEQGTTNPSIGTLLRLSEALGVTLQSLVDVSPAATATVTRSGEGAVLWTGDRGGRGVLLGASESPDVVELWDWTLAPGERHGSEAHAAGTRELLQLRKGGLVIEVGDTSHELDVGDALVFDGDVPHAYSNPFDTVSRFTLCVFEPGAKPTTEVSHV